MLPMTREHAVLHVKRFEKSKNEPTRWIYFLFGFFQSFQQNMQNYCKKSQTIIRVFCRESKEVSSLAGKQFKKKIYHCWVSFPLLSLVFQNKGDFLYAQCFLFLLMMHIAYRMNRVTQINTTNISTGICRCTSEPPGAKPVKLA